jgi:hypothetical protein
VLKEIQDLRFKYQEISSKNQEYIFLVHIIPLKWFLKSGV